MKFEHFGIFHFLSYAADKQNKQTDRQTEPNIRPTPTLSICLCNYKTKETFAMMYLQKIHRFKKKTASYVFK